MTVQTITTDGNYQLETIFNPTKTAIYVSGTMGAATAKITYKNDAGTHIDMDDGAVVLGQYEIAHGSGKEIFLTITGADGSTAIEVDSVAL